MFQLRVVARVRGFTWDLHPLNSLADFSCHFSDTRGYFMPISCQFLRLRNGSFWSSVFGEMPSMRKHLFVREGARRTAFLSAKGAHKGRPYQLSIVLTLMEAIALGVVHRTLRRRESRGPQQEQRLGQIQDRYNPGSRCHRRDAGKGWQEEVAPVLYSRHPCFSGRVCALRFRTLSRQSISHSARIGGTREPGA